jgi:hypothetical protein
MHPQLQRIDDRIVELTAGLSDSRLLQHPTGKWCAAEIFEHLALSYSGTAKGASRVLAAEKPIATTATAKQRLLRFVVVGLGFIPGGRQAPKGVVPTGKLGALESVTRIRADLRQMDELLSQCEQRFGSSVALMDHPIFGPLNLSQWRKFHLVHGLHHLKQVQERCTEGARASN